jgi:hypothetical protein
MPEEDSPDPDEIEDQMRSAIERIRAKLTEPEPKSEDPQAENETEDLLLT